MRQEDRGSIDSAIALLMVGVVERIRREVHLLCADNNGTPRCAELTIRGVAGGCADGRVREVAILEDMPQRRPADDDGLGFAGTDPLTGLANRRAFLVSLYARGLTVRLRLRINEGKSAVARPIMGMIRGRAVYDQRTYGAAGAGAGNRPGYPRRPGGTREHHAESWQGLRRDRAENGGRLRACS